MRGLTVDCWLRFCCAVAILLPGGARVTAAERQVRGRVIDADGKPVAGAAVDCFWRANGPAKDANGKPLDLKIEQNVKLFWSNLGAMEPTVLARSVVTAGDGRFSLAIPDIYHGVMAMDRDRQRGGLVIIAKGREDQPLEIKLAPLVCVRGSFEGPAPGQKPHWTHVYIRLPEDPTRPLDSCRLVSCGSFDAKFEVRLPPGRFILQGYSQYAGQERFEGELIPDRELTLETGAREVDLGRLRLLPHHNDTPTRRAKAKSAGAWGDYSKYYGKALPNWHITDARGVSKEVQLADFKDKWVLVEFWGFSCRPCMKTSLPKLIKFYEDHKAQRDRFEILAICVETDDELKSIADVDRKLVPYVRYVWEGKTLPFPVLLDSTFETWQRYGIEGMGQVLLIDPEGRLVKGDETVLAEKLSSPPPTGKP
jgi:thiol-disulfide isomerase/thioredoxin